MNNIIPAVRILPMSVGEFDSPTNSTTQSHLEVQSQFFLTELPSRESGRYFYRKNGLDAEPGTIVLFQYDKRIIASAVYAGRERFEKPVGPYHGAIKLDIHSIKVFTPVGPEILKTVWPDEFTGFSNVMAQLNSQSFPLFEQKLTDIRMPVLSLDCWNQCLEDSVNEALKRSSEHRKARIANASPIPKRIAVSAVVFDRNPDVVAEVLDRASGVCEQCKLPAPFIRRSNGTPYLEVHHTKRLADGGEDSVDNAVALCPNCHRKSHYS